MLRGLALIAVASGCSVVTPPPVMPGHDLAQPLPEGTTTISLVVGYAFGVWVDAGAGGVLRVGHQLDERHQIGVDLMAGWRRWSRFAAVQQAEEDYERCKKPDPAPPGDMVFIAFNDVCELRNAEEEPGRLLGVRGFLRWNTGPGSAHAVVVGAGYTWVDNGLRALTMDVGYLSSTRLRARGGYYGGPVLAVAVPLDRGPAFHEGRRPATTFHVGASGGGLLGGEDSAWSGSLELTLLVGVSTEKTRTAGRDGALILAASGAGTWRSDER